MKKERRVFSPEDRLAIFQEGKGKELQLMSDYINTKSIC
jgi:hypothetical protein